MTIDHVLESIRPHYEVTLECFIEEHKKGDYKKLSDNPCYGELKTIINAMNCIKDYLGWERIRLKDEVSFYLGR